MTKNGVIRLLFSLLLIPTGAAMVLSESANATNSLISDIGLAFIVAGVISTFHEVVLRRLEGSESAETFADHVHERFQKDPISVSGFRVVSTVRKGYAGYYLWAVDNSSSDLFFAGRSVLHRVQADFQSRGLGTVHGALARRIEEGCKVRIMFLDPRSNLLDRLAREENQTPELMLSDLACSIGIVVELYNYLSTVGVSAPGALEVRIYDEIPYFAFHKVGSSVIVGFYFTSALGHGSAAYELMDRQTQNFFEGHFVSMFDHASNGKLCELDPHRGGPVINSDLLSALRVELTERLGEAKVAELIPAITGTNDKTN